MEIVIVMRPGYASRVYIVDTLWKNLPDLNSESLEEHVRGIVKKWGNSAAVRIPSAVLAATRLGIDELVDVREEDGRIIIEPVRKKTYTLAGLLKGVTPENIHKETDFGEPMGKEIW